MAIERGTSDNFVCLARPDPTAAPIRRARLPAAQRLARTDLAAVLGPVALRHAGADLLRLEAPRGMKHHAGGPPPLEIRLWIIYTVDDSGLVGGAAPPTREKLVPMYVALVEAMRQDWAGTGIEFVFLPDLDFEIRKDSRLNNDFTLAPRVRQKFPARASEFTKEQIAAMRTAASNDAHRNQVTAERPNTLLWLICERNWIALEDVKGRIEDGGEPQNWVYQPHIAGSWSSINCDFMVLNKWDFANSIEHGKKDASRAAHEIGHFFGLPHTHWEKDELAEPTEPTGPGRALTPAMRLDRWKKAIAAYLDKKLPAKSTPADALQFLDNDHGGGIDDTPVDPGPDMLKLANLAAGWPADPLGKVASVSVQPANVTGPVVFTPDRRNVMSYYLDDGGPGPMNFSPDQIEVMRAALISGKRRRLVAAQLGVSAEPSVRLCAVWSPNAGGQAYGARDTLKTHEARHEEWRAKNFHLASQCAYANGNTVLYDGIWNQGARLQHVIRGCLGQQVEAEIESRAARGWRVVHIQAYRHPGTGLRYNVIFERGSQKQVVKLNLLKAGLDQAWNALTPVGNRLRHLDSAIDETGQIRFAAVFEPGSQKQGYVADLTLADMIAAHGAERAKGRKFSTLSVGWTADGPRYSGICNPDAADHVIIWLHVRERIRDVYDEMWWQGFKLKSLHTITVWHDEIILGPRTVPDLKWPQQRRPFVIAPEVLGRVKPRA